MAILDVIFFGTYLLAMLGMGVWFYGRSHSAAAFTIASGRLPAWVVGLSLFGTYLSSITFLALPGKTFAGNWAIIAFAASMPLAAWAGARWFVPLYREAGELSAYAYLEHRFGIWARLYAVIFFLLMQIARIAVNLFLVALVLQALSGWSLVAIIIGLGLLVTVYTLLGGMEAVIWTDVVQSIVLTLGALLTISVIVTSMPEGAAQIFSLASQHGKFSLGSFALQLDAATFWVIFLYGLAINLQTFGVDQSYVQRYMAADSVQSARRSLWLAALGFIPVGILFLFIGTALFAYFQVHADALPTGLRPDQVFPHFIVSALPAGLGGLVLAAVFAACMSSMDSAMHASSTILLTDIVRRVFHRAVNERVALRILRAGVALAGLLGMVAALTMIKYKSVLDIWWHLAGIFSGGTLGLFLLGILSHRAARPEAMLGLVLAVLIILWAALTGKQGGAFAFPLHSLMITVTASLAVFLTGILLSRRRSQQ